MIIIPQITHFYNWIFIILRISKIANFQNRTNEKSQYIFCISSLKIKERL